VQQSSASYIICSFSWLMQSEEDDTSTRSIYYGILFFLCLEGEKQ